MTREGVVQAALTVERWCKSVDYCGTGENEISVCPFYVYKYGICGFHALKDKRPEEWNLEEFLRTRGMRDERQK